MLRLALPLALLSCTQVLAQSLDRGDWWDNWRGPLGTGASLTANPPTEWSEDQNIKWKVALPGLGSSSPVLWQDRIYLTTAVQTDRKGEITALEPPDRRAVPPPDVYFEFLVMALDRKDGSVIWQTEVTEAIPHEGGHSTNSHASASPLTDGEFIYANFGSRGLFCLDMQGEIQWSKQLGLMRTRRQYGEATSAAVYGEVLVVNWDHEGDSFIVALDRKTGEEHWRRDREEVTSWSTPIIVEVDDRPQVVINATSSSRGYDLASGDVVWSLSGMTVNCIPSPIVSEGVAYLMSGYRGQMLQAVLLEGAEGDLAESENLLWSHTRNTSYVPSGLLYEGLFYFLRGNNGVLSCVDSISGEVHYEGQKLGGIRSVYSSPVAAAGRIYITSRDGLTKVVKMGPEYRELASNQLDDAIDATPAIVGNEIFLRGQEFLYCIAEN